jgi:DNA-binding MarR family transcriptional regulator
MTVRKRSPGDRIQASLDVLQLQSSRTHLFELLRRDTNLVIDPVPFSMMSALDHLGPLRITALAREVGLDRQAVSRHMAHLERANLVERGPDPYDRRSILLQLTDAGRLELEQLQREIAGLIDRQLMSWSEGEAARFANQLEQFVDGVRGPWLAARADFHPVPAGDNGR